MLCHSQYWLRTIGVSAHITKNCLYPYGGVGWSLVTDTLSCDVVLGCLCTNTLCSRCGEPASHQSSCLRLPEHFMAEIRCLLVLSCVSILHNTHVHTKHNMYTGNRHTQACVIIIQCNSTSKLLVDQIRFFVYTVHSHTFTHTNTLIHRCSYRRTHINR